MDETAITTTNKDLRLHDPVEQSKFEYAVSLFGPSVREKIRTLPKELLDMSDEDAEKQLEPNMTDKMLRSAMWREVERVQANPGAVFRVANIYNGICSSAHFYAHICNLEKRLAYIVRPMQTYDDKAGEIVDYGITRLREALQAKLVYPNGYLDAKATKVVLDIVQYFENRTKGRIAHQLKVDSKTQTLTANVNIGVRTSPQDLRDLDSKLKDLRKQIAQYEGDQLTHNLPEKIVHEMSHDDGETGEETND